MAAFVFEMSLSMEGVQRSLFFLVYIPCVHMYMCVCMLRNVCDAVRYSTRKMLAIHNHRLSVQRIIMLKSRMDLNSVIVYADPCPDVLVPKWDGFSSAQWRAGHGAIPFFLNLQEELSSYWWKQQGACANLSNSLGFDVLFVKLYDLTSCKGTDPVRCSASPRAAEQLNSWWLLPSAEGVRKEKR